MQEEVMIMHRKQYVEIVEDKREDPKSRDFELKLMMVSLLFVSAILMVSLFIKYIL